MKHHRRSVSSAAVLLLASAAARGADSPALTFTPGPFQGIGGGPGYTHGWAFQVNQDIVVTELGVSDQFAPGFWDAHNTYLWKMDRTLLRSVTIGPGEVGTIGPNLYRYVPIQPVTLQAGQSYVIGVTWPANTNDVFYSCVTASNITFDPRITWIDGRIAGIPDAFPNQSYGQGTGALIAIGSCNFLIAPPPCVGDINGDGQVNTADLTLLLSRFGQSVGAGEPADLNSDGVVNTADLTLLLARFGQACA